MAKVLVGSPFEKFELSYQHRREPNALSHLLRRDTLSPPSASRLREVHETHPKVASGSWLRVSSEFVTQAELKDARLSQCGGVLSEPGRAQNVDVRRIWIETDRVGHVERFSAELQCVRLVFQGK